jgi:carbon-monoxide dehydrogenase medium subunit
VKPHAFELLAPATVADAVTLLADRAGDAVVLAGGQSLVPALNFRLGAPAALVDVNGVSGLAGVEEDGNGLRIGALTRHRVLLDDELLRRRCPLLAAAARHIGHVPIRNRGTVGGSVAHADPAAEILAVLALFDGTVELTSTRGVRVVPVTELVLGPYFTAKEADELVTAVHVLPNGGAWGFHEVARRHGDFALAGAAVVLQLEDGVIRAARVSLLGTEPVPRRIAAVEEALAGVAGADAVGVAGSAIRAAELDVLEDPRVPSDYRRHLAAVAVARAVAGAVAA